MVITVEIWERVFPDLTSEEVEKSTIPEIVDYYSKRDECRKEEEQDELYFKD